MNNLTKIYVKNLNQSLDKYIFPIKFLLAIVTGMFVFFSFQALFGNMPTLSIEFSAFGFRCATTGNDRFLNAMFFITPACILMFVFGLIESSRRTYGNTFNSSK